MLETKNFLDLSQEEHDEVFLARSDKINAKYLSKRTPSRSSYNLFLKYLEFNKALSYFKVLKNGDFLGVVALYKQSQNTAFITIYKNPSLKNVGSLLFSALLELAQNEGIKILLAKVIKENKSSIRLLLKNGFCFVKTLKSGEVFMQKYI